METRRHLTVVAEAIRRIGGEAVNAARLRTRRKPGGVRAVDDYVAVLEKAMRGNGLRKWEVAEMTGSEAIYALCEGKFHRNAAARVARLLGLSPDALCGLGEDGWNPPAQSVKGLKVIHATAYGVTQNTWVAWDAATGEAVVFDPPADCTPVTAFLTAQRLRLKYAFITHAHADDCFDLEQLSRAGVASFNGGTVPAPGAELLTPGRSFSAGGLKVEARLTPGHTENSTCYRVSGLSHPVVVVGDSILAGSIGCTMYSYGVALQSVRSEILTLPESTVICPRHGPPSTVGAEKRGNPFFAP